MSDTISELQQARSAYQPKLPQVLESGSFHLQAAEAVSTEGLPAEITSAFPHSIGKPLVTVVEGAGDLPNAPLNVGVVFSGGQAPGGHNVAAGLLDSIKKVNPDSKLIGFLNGPIGVVKSRWVELTPEKIAPYRNTGGFDLIASGRDKIEKPEDLAACKKTMHDLGLSALVVVGGDDSNTNAALLAEYFLAENAGLQVIGVPKTIDGDMKNDYIEASFGFDSAAKVFSELVGSICRDALSARKYWHFIRLMGRAASHITLEVGLQTQPNLTIISEEAEAKGWSLSEIVDQIVEVVANRSNDGNDFGVILIPEGLLEFLADVKSLLVELSHALGSHEDELAKMASHAERQDLLKANLSADAAKVYFSLPESIQEVLLRRDKHGNIPLSQVETEKLLIDLVTDRIKQLKSEGKFKGSFSPLAHFFGYEGRCVQPSNFDSDYCYSLGYTAGQLVRGGYTGYTVSASNLAAPAAEWVMGGVPVTSMLTVEIRKGKPKPVIKKTLVDLEGPAFAAFAEARADWAKGEMYLFPGPIQYFGPSEVCDALTKTLALERGQKNACCLL